VTKREFSTVSEYGTVKGYLNAVISVRVPQGWELPYQLNDYHFLQGSVALHYH